MTIDSRFLHPTKAPFMEISPEATRVIEFNVERLLNTFELRDNDPPFQVIFFNDLTYSNGLPPSIDIVWMLLGIVRSSKPPGTTIILVLSRLNKTMPSEQ